MILCKRRTVLFENFLVDMGPNGASAAFRTHLATQANSHTFRRCASDSGGLRVCCNPLLRLSPWVNHILMNLF